MPKLGGVEVNSLEEAKGYWENATYRQFSSSMPSSHGWDGWLKVAANVITDDGTVFEPGSGTGRLFESLPDYELDYFGMDLNKTFVDKGIRKHGSNPRYNTEVGDFYDIFETDLVFDWIVVVNLFALFPEHELYNLLPRLWERTNKGLSIGTHNKLKHTSRRKPKYDVTRHHPDELMAAVDYLPDVLGYEVNTDLSDGHLDRKMMAYVYKWDYEGEINSIVGVPPKRNL